MRTFGVLNSILVFVLSVTLVLLTFSSVIHDTLKDVPSMLTFFKNARVYDNASTIIRLEIRSMYPRPIKNNIFLSGIANGVVDAVVTPNLVALAAQPVVELSVGFANSPAAIINNKVVLPTATYKQQAIAILGDFGLPKIIVLNASLLIDSLPKELVLVDLNKRPNSPLGIILKAHGLWEQNETVLTISWCVLLGVLTILLLHNARHIQKLFLSLVVGFGIPGILIVLLYVSRSWYLNMVLPNASNAIESAQNLLISDVVSYLTLQMKNTALFYLGIGLVSFLCWKYMHFEPLQIKINKVLRKFHIPTVTVKIK